MVRWDGRAHTSIVVIAAALAACGVAFSAVTDAAAQHVPTAQEQTPAAAGATTATDDLRDLDAMTFSCPKAGLNAAAREAAKVPSQGTYQFAYFRIHNDSHHALYEIHFKSNYQGEADLKYCVAVYCQQGWDPTTSKTSVTLMDSQHQPAGGAAHAADCAPTPPPVKRRAKR